MSSGREILLKCCIRAMLASGGYNTGFSASFLVAHPESNAMPAVKNIILVNLFILFLAAKKALFSHRTL